MTPLVLITGFLGSGKTSLLRQLLPELKRAGVQPHVILNDYANADLDSSTLRDLVPDITPITGSCVCCNSMDDLILTLDELTLGERDVVLVEANGTTDPLPLIEVFLLTRLRHRYPCLLQINLIDAKRWQKHGAENELERMQARTASHLMFTWLDAAAKERQLNVRTEVKKINPRAVEIEVAAFAHELISLASMSAEELPPPFIKWPQTQSAGGPSFSLPHLPGAKPATIAPPAVENIFTSPLFNRRNHAKHALAHRFRAVQLEVPHGLRPLQLVAWLEALPPAIVRAKGIVQFEGQAKRFHYFQRVEDTVSFNELMAEPPGDLTLALLVGIDLDEPALRAQATRMLHDAAAVGFPSTAAEMEEARQ